MIVGALEALAGNRDRSLPFPHSIGPIASRATCHAVDQATQAKQGQHHEAALEELIAVPPAACPLLEAGHVIFPVCLVDLSSSG